MADANAGETTANQSKVDHRKGGIGGLPDEILALILSFVPCVVRLGPATLVCRQWCCVARDESAVHIENCCDPLRTQLGIEHVLRDATTASDRAICLDSVRNRGIPKSKRTCEAAAEKGHLDCLRYARRHHCQWDKHTCEAAAKGGHLACLRYARENKCPWDERTCEAAAKAGHLVCLQYAHEHGCPWDGRAHDAALCGGHTECAAYMRECGCLPSNERYAEYEGMTFRRAIAYGKPRVSLWTRAVRWCQSTGLWTSEQVPN